MFWERRNYFYLLIDFSPPICKVIHLTWCALLGWKPLGWSENHCWASSAGCRCNDINEWEMALGFLQSLGIVGWRMKLEVFSLITFFVFLPLSLSEGHCLTWLGWNTLPAWSGNTLPTPPPSKRELTGKGGAWCLCKQRYWEVRCNLHYKSGWISFKDKRVESTKQGRSKCWYLDVDCNCEKGLALRQIQN